MCTTFTLYVKSTDTVEAVKAKIHKQEGIPAVRQGLIFEGKHLRGSRTLHDYNISLELTLDLTYWC